MKQSNLNLALNNVFILVVTNLHFGYGYLVQVYFKRQVLKAPVNRLQMAILKIIKRFIPGGALDIREFHQRGYLKEKCALVRL